MTTIAAPVRGVRPVGAAHVGAQDGAARELEQPLGRAQISSIGVAVVLGVVVAGYGLVGSYTSISDLAARHDVPLAGWVPAGIDGGLVAVVVLDPVLTWVGTPVGWLRQLVRVLSVGTVAANAVAGWPDPVAVGCAVIVAPDRPRRNAHTEKRIQFGHVLSGWFSANERPDAMTCALGPSADA